MPCKLQQFFYCFAAIVSRQILVLITIPWGGRFRHYC
jgi:hypothetical protein